MPTENSAERVKRRRSELGLTQSELAERLGVDIRAVQYWERGEKNPRASILKLLDTLDAKRSD